MRLQLHFLRLFCLLALPTTAFADVEFYTYGGFRPIVNAFTNLSVIFDSEDYLVFGFVVAIIGVTVGMLVKSGLAALGKATSKDALAILFLAMFGTALFGALFEPKTTVHIYDPTHNQYESVGDIPLALAFIASGTNLLERFATDTVSDGIGFGRTRHANGKSLELMFNILGGDPVSHNIYISKSIERYFKGCVVAAAANSDTFSGFDYNAVLNGTADIWTELARTRDSDQRFLWFNQANPGGIVMNCEEGYDNIRDVLLNPDTFTTYIENACIKSGYESDTPEGILDCTDLIEETVPLIFSGSVDTSPENIAGMATLANGLYMTLAETPGSAITSIGNMKQMSQGYGSTIIAEGWLPSMRSATLVIILSFTPLIILMIFTPFVFRALHMLSALFLFLTIWGASDAIIHVVIVDNVMSMLAEVKTFEGGLRSFLTAPSELQKAIAMFGKMQSLGVMFAGLMTAFYFKFSSMQFANMGEKLSNNIDSATQQTGNHIINPVNRMDTTRQAASTTARYNSLAQVGSELTGALVQQTATWHDSANAHNQQALGAPGFSPQKAITMGTETGGRAAGAISATPERSLVTGSNALGAATDMNRTSQLTNGTSTTNDQKHVNGLAGLPFDQSNTLAGINQGGMHNNISDSKDDAIQVGQSEIAHNESDMVSTEQKLAQAMGGVHSLGMQTSFTSLENVSSDRVPRQNSVRAGYKSNVYDIASAGEKAAVKGSPIADLALGEYRKPTPDLLGESFKKRESELNAQPPTFISPALSGLPFEPEPHGGVTPGPLTLGVRRRREGGKPQNDSSDANGMTSLLPSQEQLLKNAAELRSIYGADIPENAYQKMEEDIRNDRLPMPQIVINDKMKEDYGVKSAYDNATGVISLAQYAVDPSSADQKGTQRLVSEEFGHHLDNLLRTHYSKAGGDAYQDEGARFARDVMSLPVSEHDIAYDGKVGSLEYHNESGHYFTTTMVANQIGDLLGLNAREKSRLATFSQLPDEIGAWDAITVQSAAVLKGGAARNARDGSDTRLSGKNEDAPENLSEYRNAVQRLNHSLTGDQNVDPLKWREELRSTMRDVWQREETPDFTRDDKLAVLGLLTHTFQDSYAHMKLGSRVELTPENRQKYEAEHGKVPEPHSWTDSDGVTHYEWTGAYYGDGLGHLFDWKSPDRIHEGVSMWKAMSHDLMQTYADISGDALEEKAVKRSHQELNKKMGLVEIDIDKAVEEEKHTYQYYNREKLKFEERSRPDGAGISDRTQMIMYMHATGALDVANLTPSQRWEQQSKHEDLIKNHYHKDGKINQYYPGANEASMFSIDNVADNINSIQASGAPVPPGIDDLNEEKALKIHSNFLNELSDVRWESLQRDPQKHSNSKKDKPWD